jgi:hypothetical protein
MIPGNSRGAQAANASRQECSASSRRKNADQSPARRMSPSASRQSFAAIGVPRFRRIGQSLRVPLGPAFDDVSPAHGNQRFGSHRPVVREPRPELRAFSREHFEHAVEDVSGHRLIMSSPPSASCAGGRCRPRSLDVGSRETGYGEGTSISLSASMS